MREFESQLQSDLVCAALPWEEDAFPNSMPIQASYISFGNIHLYSRQYLLLKRGIDIVGSLALMLVCLLPGTLIAAAIIVTSRGPVFYREFRVGRGGRPFLIWKFRSMRRKCEWQDASREELSSEGCLHLRINKNPQDSRLTSIGGFLRRWSLDELPQLLNVLRGEMSLVGPRPVVEAELSLYGDLCHFYLEAVPGLSGLWQVSGRSNLNFSARANLDAFYVTNWSLLTDIGILLRTIPAVLGRVGAR